jgi:FtsH-binding integral membrane protein
MNILFVVPLICAIVIYIVSFKDGIQVCDNYILVSYLYALFYLSVVSVGIKVCIDKKWWKLSLGAILGLIVGIFVTQITMLSIPKEFVIGKHLLSVGFSMLLSLLLSSFFVAYAPSSIAMAVLSTMVVFVLLTLMAWKYQEQIASKITMSMIVLFFVLIFAELLIGMFYPNSLLEKGIILVVLMIIGYLLMMKTKQLIENEKKCKTEGGPDYVNEGTGLMLSFENLLIRILALFGKRKLK